MPFWEIECLHTTTISHRHIICFPLTLLSILELHHSVRIISGFSLFGYLHYFSRMVRFNQFAFVLLSIFLYVYVHFAS